MITSEREAHQIESLLEVSLPVIFQPDPLRKDSRQYQSVLRGWQRGEYLMFDRPKVDGRSLLMLRESQDCRIRYMLEGKACAFVSRVMDFDSRRHNPYMRIRWPTQVDFTYFRRGERIKVHFPCSIHSAGKSLANGMLIDLSQGGCGFETTTPFEKGQEVQVNCELPNGVQLEGLPLVICAVRPLGRAFIHGCAFGDGTHTGKEEIGFFVVSRLAAEHGSPATEHARRVLVLDHASERSSVIARQVGRKGLETTLSASIVEACYRLKSVPHAAVAVAADQADLPGVEFLRLLQTTGDFDALPAVLYGTDNGQVEIPGGRTAPLVCVPTSPTVVPDAARALVKLLG